MGLIHQHGVRTGGSNTQLRGVIFCTGLVSKWNVLVSRLMDHVSMWNVVDKTAARFTFSVVVYQLPEVSWGVGLTQL